MGPESIAIAKAHLDALSVLPRSPHLRLIAREEVNITAGGFCLCFQHVSPCILLRANKQKKNGGDGDVEDGVDGHSFKERKPHLPSVYRRVYDGYI